MSSEGELLTSCVRCDSQSSWVEWECGVQVWSLFFFGGGGIFWCSVDLNWHLPPTQSVYWFSLVYLSIMGLLWNSYVCIDTLKETLSTCLKRILSHSNNLILTFYFYVVMVTFFLWSFGILWVVIIDLYLCDLILFTLLTVLSHVQLNYCRCWYNN